MAQYYRPVILNPLILPQAEKITVFMDACDYNTSASLIEHAKQGNRFVETFEYGLCPEGYHHKSRVVWAGSMAMPEKTTVNLYNQCTEYSKIRPSIHSTHKYRFLLNHSKKLYVDKADIQLHPLPFLTVEGCDFPSNSHLIGSWARDVISVEKNRPVGFDKIAFYLE